jgi:hypothetical protein
MKLLSVEFDYESDNLINTMKELSKEIGFQNISFMSCALNQILQWTNFGHLGLTLVAKVSLVGAQ